MIDIANADVLLSRKDVAKVGAKCGLRIQRPEVVEGLRVLVEAGLAKAYDLSAAVGGPFSVEFQGMPPLDVPEEYFTTYVTNKGKPFQRD